MTTLQELEERWAELDRLAAADELAVLDGELDKQVYITRDLLRQAERSEIEFKALALAIGGRGVGEGV